MTKHIATAVLAMSPGHVLNFYSALRAVHPPHGIGQKDWDIPQRDKLETPGPGHVIIARTDFTASRALRLACAAGAHFGYQARVACIGICGHLRINETLDWVNPVE